MRARAAIAIGGVLVALTARAADGWWISPDLAWPGAGETVGIRLHEGPPFVGPESPRPATDVARLQRLWRGGRADLTAADDAVPITRFRPEPSTVQLLVLDSRDGTRFCKAVIVTRDARSGDPLRWSELGQTLEIVPQSDPVELDAGVTDEFEAQVLFEREPLPGVRVGAVPEADPSALREARTDDLGLVRFRLDVPGRWWIGVGHRGGCESCADARVMDFEASLVLAVGRPR